MGQCGDRKRPRKSQWRRSFLLPSFLTLAYLLNSCKPAQNSSTLATLPDEQASVAEMAGLMNSGIAQLELEMRALDTTAGSDALGLTSSSWGNSRTKPNYIELFKKVSGIWKNTQGNPCAIWAPILRSIGKELIHPYFFTGGSAEAGIGLHAIIGRDYVWDFYNLQLSAFNYKALEVVFGSGTAGAGVNAYIGLGFGQKGDVNDAWSGRFMTTGVSGSLPVLSDYLSGHLAHFSAQTAQGTADFRFRGGSIGISAAVSAPTTIPGAVQIANGYWIIDKRENQKLSQRFTNLGIKNSMQGAGTCQGQCVRIDNSQSGAGYMGRAVNLARSIPAVMFGTEAGAFYPGLDKIMLLAIATGAYRDTKNSAYACRR